MKLARLSCLWLFLSFILIAQKGTAQGHKRICVIGSSSAYGYFGNPPQYPRDSAWAFKIKKYYKDAGIIDTLYNLAVISTDCYVGMPSSYVPPAGRNVPNPACNITRAVNLAPKPDIIIVNYPSNSYDWLDTGEVIKCLQTIKDSANANGIACYITTTQPRNTFSPSERQKLKSLKASIQNTFGVWSIDFWTDITVDSTLAINPLYSLGDGVHLNAAGHVILTNKVIQKNIFGNLIPTANAGNDQVITFPANSVNLNGGGTDADGTIASYQWAKVSGPLAGTITNAGSASTTATGLTTGVYLFVLAVTDNSGATANDTVQVTVKSATNIPPVANAGSDKVITLPVNNVSLNGSGTDADGTIASYQWAKFSGPSPDTIITASSASTFVTGLVAGVYQFILTVTDNNGAQGNDTVQITVKAANIKPVADAGVDQTITLPVNSVTLNGSGTDPDGTISSYQWAKVSGPSSGTIINTGSANTTVTGLVVGTYQFTLTVTDNSGSTGKDTVQITIKTGNGAPLANAGPDQLIVLPANSVTLTGSGTDADGTIKSYKWAKLSGPSSGSISSSTSATTKVTSLAAGIYLFTLTVTDNSGLTGKDTVQVTVNVNTAPVANAGTDQVIVLPASSVTLTGSGKDIDGTISSYKWAKISGPSSAKITSTSSATTTVTALVAGVYKFSLTVTDNGSATGKDTVQVTVNATNTPPVVNAGVDQVIMLPNNITLTGSGTDVDGTIASYLWTKISGPSATITNAGSASTTVTGLTAGIYKFALTVADNTGATGKDTVQVAVNAANVAPMANTGPDQSITLPANSIILSGSGTDADGTIASYQWAKLSGPLSGTITNGGSASTTVTGLTSGLYQYVLTVTDNIGATGKDTVQITVNAANVAPLANAGPDQSITLPTNSITLNGGGTDADGTITSYQWVKLSGPSSGIITNAGSASSTVTGLTAGIYQYELTVTDNIGAAGKDTVQITVNSSAGTNSSDTINVNIYGGSNPYNNIAWNNWDVGTTEATNKISPVLNYINGTGSGITATFNYVLGIADNGAANGATMCPQEVLRYASYSTSNRTLTLNNLSAGSTYSIEFYSSRANTGNSTTYTINGQAQAVITDNNKSIPVSFTNISPNANKQVVINITKGTASTYQYVNGFRIIKTTISSRPAITQVENNTMQFSKKILLFSSPSYDDNVTINYSDESKGILVINILDIEGRKLRSFSFKKNQPYFQQLINVAGLSTGMYYIQLLAGNSIKAIEKLIKR